MGVIMSNKEVISKTTKEVFLQELLNLRYNYIHYSSNGQTITISDNNSLSNSTKDMTIIIDYKSSKDLFEIIPRGFNEVKDIRHELGIIDWRNIPIDTPVNVWNKGCTTKERRHFAGFKDGRVHTWTNGRTFFSNYKYTTESWDYAELVKK